MIVSKISCFSGYLANERGLLGCTEDSPANRITPVPQGRQGPEDNSDWQLFIF